MTFLNLTLGSPVVRAAETVTGELGVVGARFIMEGGPSEGRFSLVEHPIVPRGLAAPVHLHTREDEFSFILEGRWGFVLGPTSCMPTRVISSTSPATSGTRSGTPPTGRRVYWRSFPRPDSSSSSLTSTIF